MRKAFELLQRMTEMYPLKSGHHALTLSSKGSGGVFVLHLLLPSGWQPVRFDESDLDKPVDALVQEIVALLASLPA
jgi:hypothetical protein